MARLPYIQPDQASAPVREALELLPPLNIFKLLANAETNFRPLLRLGQSVLTDQQLDPLLRELAILRVAQLTPAEYEWVQHVAIAKAVGASDEQVAALERGQGDAECFSADQALVLRFTTELVEDAAPSEQTFVAISKLLSAREVVELTLAVGYYMLIARVMAVGQIDLEPAAGIGAIIPDE